MRAKLEAVRVELLEWSYLDENTLRLYFERVPTYLMRRDFEKKTESVFTDFGYLELILKKNEGFLDGQKPSKKHWLNEYINDEDIFIEEELPNSITFWEGQDEERYDWGSSYSISFDDIEIIDTPLSHDEWKAKYTDMVLKYGEVYFEQWDKLELKFFGLFKAMMEGAISHWPEDVALYKNDLSRRLNEIPKYREERIKENEAAKAEFYRQNQPVNKTQQEINQGVFNFWESLKNLFK